MTTLPAIAEVSLRPATIVVSPPAVKRRRRSSRRAVGVFVVTMLALNFGFAAGMDHVFPTVRDPEYGRRLSRLRARQDEHPDRPFVVMLGSSRTAMGLRPTTANADAGPLVFNFAQIGSGPVMQLMTLRRLLHHGVTPAAVVLEYWPPFLREDDTFAEEARIDKHRLLPEDKSFVRDYFDTHEHTLAIMRQIRQRPLYEHRLRIVSQLAPGWLSYTRRLDGPWQKLDAWGWLPGFDRDPPPAERAERHRLAGIYYGELFQTYRLHEKAERAMRELLTTCRDRGIPVALAWLPESTEFRAWYPPAVLQASDRFLATLRGEFGVPLIDARAWVADPHLADGFHLTRAGADVFSRRFGDEVRAMFENSARGKR